MLQAVIQGVLGALVVLWALGTAMYLWAMGEHDELRPRGYPWSVALWPLFLIIETAQWLWRRRHQRQRE